MGILNDMRDKIIFIAVSVVAVVVAALVLLYGTKNLPSPQSPPTVQDAEPSVVAVPFTELAQGTQSKVSSRVNYHITSATELKEIWDLVNATGTPPSIDFTTHAVLAVFAGQKPTAGYSIAVKEVKDAERRMVTISLTNPGEGCMLAQALSAPYVLAVVPATSLPLTHEDVPSVVNCK